MVSAKWSGGCQCGTVRFRAEPDHASAHFCHCRMCQKAVGAPFAAHVGVAKVSLEWTRGAPSEFESSDQIYRGFCRDCGTYLYFRRANSERQSMAIAAFDRAAEITIIAELGIESRWPALVPLPVEQLSSEDDNPGCLEAIQASNHQHPDHDT